MKDSRSDVKFHNHSLTQTDILHYDCLWFHQLFKGMFFHCKGPSVKHIVNRTQCEKDTANTWVNQKYNFDNLGQVSQLSVYSSVQIN